MRQARGAVAGLEQDRLRRRACPPASARAACAPPRRARPWSRGRGAEVWVMVRASALWDGAQMLWAAHERCAPRSPLRPAAVEDRGRLDRAGAFATIVRTDRAESLSAESACRAPPCWPRIELPIGCMALDARLAISQVDASGACRLTSCRAGHASLARRLQGYAAPSALVGEVRHIAPARSEREGPLRAGGIARILGCRCRRRQVHQFWSLNAHTAKRIVRSPVDRQRHHPDLAIDGVRHPLAFPIRSALRRRA